MFSSQVSVIHEQIQMTLSCVKSSKGALPQSYTHSFLFPGKEAESRNNIAADKILRVSVRLENILGYLPKVAVITDDPGQRGCTEGLTLLRSEYPRFLPPESR